MAGCFPKTSVPVPVNSEEGSCWDRLCAATQHDDAQSFGEWTSTDLFFGDYVNALEDTAMPAIAPSPQGGSSEANSNNAPGQEQSTKLPRWKTRTAKQHEDNKRFQREYRARKKAKLKEMQSQVHTYSSKLDDLSELQAATEDVAQQNAALEEALHAREAELFDIREELVDGKTSEASYQSSRPSGNFLTRMFSRGKSREQEVAAITHSFITQMDELKTFLEAKKVEPSGDQEYTGGLEYSTAAELEQRCESVMQACMGVLNLDGPNLDRLAHTLSEKMERSEPVREKYARVVTRLQLSEEQRQQVLAFLEKVARSLERIYLDRQGLNMRVMALIGPSMAALSLTPPDVSKGQPADFGAELRAALAGLQENLKEEQRLESEQHYTVFKQILAPAQGAWLIALAAPDHCDLLAFAAAVKSLYGGGPKLQNQLS